MRSTATRSRPVRESAPVTAEQRRKVLARLDCAARQGVPWWHRTGRESETAMLLRSWVGR